MLKLLSPHLPVHARLCQPSLESLRLPAAGPLRCPPHPRQALAPPRCPCRPAPPPLASPRAAPCPLRRTPRARGGWPPQADAPPLPPPPPAAAPWPRVSRSAAFMAWRSGVLLFWGECSICAKQGPPYLGLRPSLPAARAHPPLGPAPSPACAPLLLLPRQAHRLRVFRQHHHA